jgi:hypothetical protein
MCYGDRIQCGKKIVGTVNDRLRRCAGIDEVYRMPVVSF